MLHAAVVDGDFYPTPDLPERKRSEGSVIFGLIVARPLAEWFRMYSIDVVLRHIEAGLAALYHTRSGEEKHAMQCELYGPLLERVLEVHQKYFLEDGLELESEFKTPRQLREAFDEFVKAHAGASPPAALPLFFGWCSPFLDDDENSAGYDAMSNEERRWLYDPNNSSFEYWGAYLSDDDWTRIVERNEYDKMQRSEGSKFLYEAWEKFYETSRSKKARHPLNQAHWCEVPPEVYLAG